MPPPSFGVPPQSTKYLNWVEEIITEVGGDLQVAAVPGTAFVYRDCGGTQSRSFLPPQVVEGS